VVFDSSKVAGTPKPRFAYLFPSANAALISVRMKGGLSEAQRTRTIALIRAAVGMSQWRLQHGEVYLVTGEPAILSDLTKSITGAIELLLVAVLLVMALMLGLIFSGRPRLLPLGIALLAVALTFGGLALVGASLTIASIAALPVLVGLAVDYAIQFLSRVGGVGPAGVARGHRAPRGGGGSAADCHGGGGECGGDAGARVLTGPDGAGLWPAPCDRAGDRAAVHADGGCGGVCAGPSPRLRRREHAPTAAEAGVGWCGCGAGGAG
jgi:hypothetical protein